MVAIKRCLWPENNSINLCILISVRQLQRVEVEVSMRAGAGKLFGRPDVVKGFGIFRLLLASQTTMDMKPYGGKVCVQDTHNMYAK